MERGIRDIKQRHKAREETVKKLEAIKNADRIRARYVLL